MINIKTKPNKAISFPSNLFYRQVKKSLVIRIGRISQHVIVPRFFLLDRLEYHARAIKIKYIANDKRWVFMTSWFILPLILLALSTGCSVKKTAVNIIADSISGGEESTIFTGETDPELVRDALPFALKMYESLLAQSPDNAKLHLETGKNFIIYANAFVHTPAKMLPNNEFDTRKSMLLRAQKLYLRGRDYVIQGLEIKFSDFKQNLRANKLQAYLDKMQKDDVPYLYWASAGWMGAYAVQPMDMELSSTITLPLMMMQRALVLQEDFDAGSIHEFFISYYGSVPEFMGGDENKARHHYQKALKISAGAKASVHLALASSISVKNQDRAEYTRLMNKALAIDVDKHIQFRLANILAQREARWSLKHINDKFF